MQRRAMSCPTLLLTTTLAYASYLYRKAPILLTSPFRCSYPYLLLPAKQRTAVMQSPLRPDASHEQGVSSEDQALFCGDKQSCWGIPWCATAALAFVQSLALCRAQPECGCEKQLSSSAVHVDRHSDFFIEGDRPKIVGRLHHAHIKPRELYLHCPHLESRECCGIYP